MKRIVFIVCLLSTSSVFAQPDDTKLFLVAVQVKNLDQAIEWYTAFLDFSVIDKKDYPDYGLKIGMMRLNDFQLELVENRKSESKVEALKKLQVEEITGFAKIAFRAKNVSTFYQRLKEKGADFKIELKDSNINEAEQFFIVADMDGNWIQFVGSK